MGFGFFKGGAKVPSVSETPVTGASQVPHHLVLQFFLLSGESHVCLGDIFKFYFDD